MTKVLLRFVPLLMVFLLPRAAFAQEDSVSSKNPRSYFNSFATGILIGEDIEPITGSLSMIHGVKINRWRLGMGVGLDGYSEWRILPVFFSTTFDYGPLNNGTFYLQFNAGYGFGRVVQDEPEGIQLNDERGGLMLNTMLGFCVVDSRFNFTVALGHKLQQASYEWHYQWWGGSKRIIDREMNRFILQIGFGLN